MDCLAPSPPPRAGLDPSVWKLSNVRALPLDCYYWYNSEAAHPPLRTPLCSIFFHITLYTIHHTVVGYHHGGLTRASSISAGGKVGERSGGAR